MNTFSSLSLLIERTFHDLGFNTRRATLMVSNRPDLGEYQFNGALEAAKITGENPRAIADRVKEALETKVPSLKVIIQGPGFLFLTPNTGQ